MSTKKRGRPPIPYDDNIANQILDLVESGLTLTDITGIEGMPSHPTMYRWIRENHDFATRYSHARQALADTLADRVLSEAMTANDAQIGRLRMDALKWVASKISPKKYGDKVEVESTGNANFSISFSVPDRDTHDSLKSLDNAAPQPQILDVITEPADSAG